METRINTIIVLSERIHTKCLSLSKEPPMKYFCAISLIPKKYLQ